MGAEQFAWDGIESSEWNTVPRLAGRIAIEADVQVGRAVFYIEHAEQHEAIEKELPALAYLEKADGSAELVVVIQCERVGSKRLAGYRFFQGGNGMATLEELTFVEGEPE